MKKNILLLSLILCTYFLLPGQTIYFYGINNKPLDDEENALTRIEVSPVGDDRFEIQNFVKIDDEWVTVSIERVKIRSDDQYLIRQYRNDRLISRFMRSYSKGPGDTFNFVEMRNGMIIRKGSTTKMIPLSLEGEVCEYYENGPVRSKSYYHQNQLDSNENWLQNGDRYIDNIYYSVDIYPTYDIDKISLQNHVLNQFKKYDLIDISGTILIGFVIMETGNMDGVHVVTGIEPGLNQVAVDAIQSFPGKWKPAILNNTTVRCYCTMPINFRQDGKNIYFNIMEFSNGVLFY